MWRLGKELVGKCVYVGQDVTFIGNVAAKIQCVYIAGEKVCHKEMSLHPKMKQPLGFLCLYYALNKGNISVPLRESHHFHSSLS